MDLLGERGGGSHKEQKLTIEAEYNLLSYGLNYVKKGSIEHLLG